MKGELSGTLLVTFITALAGLCSGIVLARTLGPTQRGEFAAILLWPTFLSFLAELGLDFSFSYYAAKDRDAVGGLWTIAWIVSIVWGGCLTLVGLVALPPILSLSPEATGNLRLALLTVPISRIVGYQSYLLLGTNHVTDFNAVRALAAVVYSGGVVGLAAVGKGSLESYTYAYLLSQGATCIVSTYLVVQRLHPSVCWRRPLLRPVFVYGLKTYASSLAAQANLRLDQLLMSILVVPRELGLYTAAVAIVGALSPLYTALATVVLPRVTNASNGAEAGSQAARHFRLGAAMGIPAAIIGAVAAPWLVPLVFGVSFEPATVPAQLLFVAAIFQGSNIILGNSLRGLGHPGKTTVAEGLGLVATVGLLLALLPGLGALGAAIASLAAYFLVTAIQLLFVAGASGVGLVDFLRPARHHSEVEEI